MFNSEYAVIRSEYSNFGSPQTEFNHIDHDFLPDSNYTCIDVLQHHEKFAQTLQIVKQYHDNIQQCYFATINGPKFVAPHKNTNIQDNNLRTHYGIIVHPKDDGVLNVGRKKYVWKENECFKFDTKQLHNVYKSMHYKRVVLIVDSSS